MAGQLVPGLAGSTSPERHGPDWVDVNLKDPEKVVSIADQLTSLGTCSDLCALKFLLTDFVEYGRLERLNTPHKLLDELINVSDRDALVPELLFTVDRKDLLPGLGIPKEEVKRRIDARSNFSRYRKLLHELHVNMVTDDLKKVSYLCSSKINRNTLETVKCGHDLFRALEKADAIKSEDVFFLIGVLRSAGLKNLAKRLEEYTNTTGYPSHSASISFGEVSESTDHINTMTVEDTARVEASGGGPVNKITLSCDIGMSLVGLKKSLIADEKEENGGSKKSNYEECLRKLEAEKATMREEFEKENRRLSDDLAKRRQHFEQYFAMLSDLCRKMLRDDEDADESPSIVADLSHKLLGSRSLESLQSLENRLFDVRTALRLIETREGQFRFVGESTTPDVASFGRVEFGQSAVAIRGAYDDDSLPPVYRQNQLARNVDYRVKEGGVVDTICDELVCELKFEDPRNCAYHVARDELFVVDSGNNRIVVCDTEGRNSRVFYTVENPQDVAISDGGQLVYILYFIPGRRLHSAIHIVGIDGQLVRTIDSFSIESKPLKLINCCAIVCHKKHIAVLSVRSKCVIIYSESGDYVRHFSLDKASIGWSMAVDNTGNFYIPDYCSGSIFIYSWDGEHRSSFGDLPEASECQMSPCIRVDDDGYICVSKYWKNRIDVYDLQCSHVASVGKGVAGCLNGPRGLCLLPDGRLVVVDEKNHRLQIF